MKLASSLAPARAERSGMELRAEKIAFANQCREFATVVGRREGPRPGWRGETVHEIHVVIVGQALRQGRFLPDVQLVPAHVRDGIALARRQPGHACWNDAETRSWRLPRCRRTAAACRGRSRAPVASMCGMTSARPKCRKRAMASPAAPTPGRMTRCARAQFVGVGRYVATRRPADRAQSAATQCWRRHLQRSRRHSWTRLTARPCCSAVRCLRCARPGAARGPSP